MIAGILARWTFDPTVIGGLLIVATLYWFYTRRDRALAPFHSRTDVWFAAAVALTILALESPLDFLADRYLFSAHMVQHLLLVLAVAPLLAISAPAALAEDMRRHMPAWLWRLGTRPLTGFVLFVSDLWVWHAPALYEATLRSESIHVLEHLSFIATAVVFWWIAFAPEVGSRRLPALARVGYVFLAGIPNTMLGAVITFAPGVLYGSYQLALEQPGLGRVLASQYGVTALGDQELGGLLMWVPGGFVYLAIIIVILVSWLSTQQAAEPEAA